MEGSIPSPDTMRILGIESSCDDTSVALLDCSKKGFFVLSEKTASQIAIHEKYGGVVPEIAGRMHAEKIAPLIEEALKGQERPEAIAVATGPGLITGLIVGTEAARALSYAWDIPVVSLNHLEGHIHSVEIGNPQIIYPSLALVVSGGHTELIYIKEQGKYKVLGQTKDDAAGECFDKVAKLLELPYPGGPQISQLAATGDTTAIDFPRPMIRENNFDFSFSGLKTSALYWLRDNSLVIARNAVTKQSPATQIETKGSPRRSAPRDDTTINDFCASFEQAIVDVLVIKTIKAAVKYEPKTIILAGGVSANKKLRKTLEEIIKKEQPSAVFLSPELKYCMDNAVMIAVAGYYHALKKDFTSWAKLSADPNWELT